MAELRYNMETLLSLRLPRYDELPAIGLYKDQVLELINGYINVFYGAENSVTDTMVNNYVKLKVIAAPVRKRYNRYQLAQLMMTCLLKKVLSIAEVRALLTISGGEEELRLAYDRFCDEVEQAIQEIFTEGGRRSAPSPLYHPEAGDACQLMSSAIGSFVCKIYFEFLLAKHDAPES